MFQGSKVRWRPQKLGGSALCTDEVSPAAEKRVAVQRCHASHTVVHTVVMTVLRVEHRMLLAKTAVSFVRGCQQFSAFFCILLPPPQCFLVQTSASDSGTFLPLHKMGSEEMVAALPWKLSRAEWDCFQLENTKHTFIHVCCTQAAPRRCSSAPPRFRVRNTVGRIEQMRGRPSKERRSIIREIMRSSLERFCQRRALADSLLELGVLKNLDEDAWATTCLRLRTARVSSVFLRSVLSAASVCSKKPMLRQVLA